MINNNTDNFGEAVQTRDEILSVVSGYVTEYMNKVFMKMSVGILITFAAALGLNASGMLANISANALWGIAIGQIILVIIMTIFVGNPNASKGLINICYMGYSALTGVTIGAFLAVFTAQSVISALLAVSLLFGALAVAGYKTRKDLSSIGLVCLAGLIACIILSLINIFVFKAGLLYMALDVAVIILFCGLTAYDVQKLKAAFTSAAFSSNFTYEDESFKKQFLEKFAVWGAFTLYLDFINIFIRFLSIFGKRR